MNEHLDRLKSIVTSSVFHLSPHYTVNLDFRRIFVPDSGILLYNEAVSIKAEENKLSPKDIVAGLTPSFQRENTAWTREMQITFVENLLCGCKTEIQFYDLLGNGSEMNSCTVLDGLQRLTAIAEFQSDTFPVFGDMYYSMIAKGGVFPRLKLMLNVYQFSDDVEACKYYIQMNKGITHSEDDLKTAYDFLNERE